MTIAGIIAEYDPFHNGHKYLTDCVRAELSPHAVVVVMSGNFTQRGMPAVLDKFTRARLAVECGGADLVLELPTVFAVNGATEFAKGGVRVLKGLGCVTHLAFGSESGNVKALQQAAELSVNEDADFKAKIACFSSKGLSYPAAYAKAFSERFPAFEGLFDNAPNDMLAREYLKQDLLQNAGLTPFAVKRVGAGHDVYGGKDQTEDKAKDSEIKSEKAFVSASIIRASLQNNVDIKHIIDDAPKPVYNALDILSKTGPAARSPHSLRCRRSSLWGCPSSRHPFWMQMQSAYFDLLLYKLVTTPESEIANILSAGEGIENNLKEAVKKAETLDELIRTASSKRFTYARVSRVLAQLLLGITKDDYYLADRGDLAYARVLAFNEKGAEVLKTAKETASIPVYSNLNKQLAPDAHERFMLDIDMRSSDIYSILSGNTIYGGSDLVNIPKLQ